MHFITNENQSQEKSDAKIMKVLMRIYALFLCLFPYIMSAHTNLFIVIHGTWATDTAWYLPGGDFFDELAASAAACDAYVVPFAWSGQLDHEQRMQAAKGLKQLIQSYDVTTRFYLIGHSHGSNVAALATQLMHKDIHNKHKISTLYTLGAPISTAYYWPDMDIVEHVYNLFSSKDIVQPVFGLFVREFPKHPRIANLRILIDDADPSHSELHHPIIAKWLPFIPHTLAAYKETGFAFFSCSNNGLIKFYFHEMPRYSIDFRKKDREDIVSTIFINESCTDDTIYCVNNIFK